MPPTLALFLTIGFVIYLFRWEARQGPPLSRALWIPLIWLLITGSRFVSQWFAVWGLPLGGGASEDGSAIDAIVFMILIFAGCIVLGRRGVGIGMMSRNNVWVAMFFAYCFFSILWSDFPFMSFKRWIKILGHPVMAFIILTDVKPEAALRSVIRKSAFVLVPFSVLLIKYYPHIGRGFEAWSGVALNMGVGLNKNCLGYLCMVFGIFFFWNLFQLREIEDRKARRQEWMLTIGFLYLIWWLLLVAHSATSLACLVIGMLMVVLLGFRWVSKKYFGLYMLIGVLLMATAESLFGIYAGVVQLLGRDPTLTDRTEVWADVLKLVEDPIVGTGFEGYWLGRRLEILWGKWNFMPNQAHNGYIEIYINLGWVGIFFLLAMIFAAFKKIQTALIENFELGRLRMAYLIVILIYNYTEATFKAVAFVWTIFHFVALEWPGKPVEPGDQSPESDQEAQSAFASRE